MGINDFRLRLVGAQYDNSDGSSRQAALAILAAGDPVEFRHEPTNPFDPNAIAVIAHTGQIGYIGAERAVWIIGKIGRRLPISAVIGQITGGKRTGLPLGAILHVNMDGEAPDY